MTLFKYQFINETLKVQNVWFVFKRFMSKKKLTKNIPSNRALDHFDDFYKAVFGEKWPSVRLALLSKPKFVAVVNNFVDTKEIEEIFQNKGAFDLRSFLEEQKNFNLKLRVKNSKKKKKSGLDNIIQQQLHEEEEKELQQLHPEGMTFKSRSDLLKQEGNESEEEYVYKPEDARTSLDFDLTRAEIDRTRLILPNDKILEGNLKEFIPATKLRGVDEYIAESDYYKYYKPSVETLSIEDEHEFEFPEHLKVYSFDRGDISDFPDPQRNFHNLYDFLKVDGAELLAALALGVQPNDRVLDMCSGSGNIAYCIFQTLRPKFLFCANDTKENTWNLFKEYLSDNSSLWKDMLYVTSQSADYFDGHSLFDKVLVNVPSTEDKTSLFDNEDNIFHVMRIKDRLKLPEIQCSLLTTGLKLVRPGGTVLYTSATLSPVQNDGVVNQALQILREDSNEEFIVKNLSPALQHTSLFFKFGDYLDLKFGTLVVPFLPINFGPRYICKIMKKEKIEERGNEIS